MRRARREEQQETQRRAEEAEERGDQPAGGADRAAGWRRTCTVSSTVGTQP